MGRASEKLIMICMVNRFHTSVKPTDLMLWSDSDLCEAYMDEHKKLMDMPIWQRNISVKW